MELQPKFTRFRAYQLGMIGSLFSYFDGINFTLIEANLGEVSESSLVAELAICGKKTIDILHITSWDNDHCKPESLKKILSFLTPSIIEIPGYQPDTDSGKESQKIISSYYITSLLISQHSIEKRNIDKTFLSQLPNEQNFDYIDVIYNPNKDYPNKNDNSLIKLFRTGSFTVASLGDVESSEIAIQLLNSKIFVNEVDVLILAHHGADNGFTTSEFIKKVNPSATVCSSNFDNQFEHPRPIVRKILNDNFVPIYTTKTGDVIIESIGNHTSRYRVLNLEKQIQKRFQVYLN